MFTATDGAIKLFEVEESGLSLVDMIETGWSKFQDMFVSDGDFVSGSF